MPLVDETVKIDVLKRKFMKRIRRNGTTPPVFWRAAQAEFTSTEHLKYRRAEAASGGRSRNHRDNTLEAGISCFEAEIAPGGGFPLLLTSVLEASYLTVADRPAYRLYGERVGTGADGEPMLRVDYAVKM